MRFKQRPEGNSAIISTGIREDWPVEDGEFEIPTETLDAAMANRLIDAGHRPLDPAELPEGVTYDPGSGERDESGSESGSSNETAEDTSGENDGEEESESDASGTESETAGVELGDRDTEELLGQLEEMDRSELYALANEEFDLGWSWSGDGSLNTEEMREELRSIIEEAS